MARTVKSRPKARRAKQHTTRKRGGGFFNRVKTLFTRKSKAQVYPVEQLSNVTKSPKSIQAQTTQLTKVYESTLQGILKDIAFAVQKSTGQPVSIDKRTPTEREWSALRLAFLTAIYSQPEFQANGEYDLEQLSQTLFGMPEDEFDKELRQFESTQFNPSIVPFESARSLGRLVSEVLRTRRETERFATVEGCANQYFSPIGTAKSFAQPFCVFITNLYDRVEQKSEILDYVKESFIVVHPKFYSSFNHLVPSYTPLDGSLPSNQVLTNPALTDAFLQRGLTVVSPKVGFLLQKDAPELWNKQYWLPKLNPKKLNYTAETNRRNAENYNSRVEPIDDTNVADIRVSRPLSDAVRIVILTLQKYAAIRRYMWTKNPVYSSYVYETNYRNKAMAVELLRPDIVFDGYVFDRAAFDAELQENQRWTSKNVYFKSYDDVRLKQYFQVSDTGLESARFSWMTYATRKHEMAIPIEPLPEDKEARQLVVSVSSNNTQVPYSSTNESRELLENLSTRSGSVAVLARNTSRASGTGRFSYKHTRRTQKSRRHRK